MSTFAYIYTWTCACVLTHIHPPPHTHSVCQTLLVFSSLDGWEALIKCQEQHICLRQKERIKKMAMFTAVRDTHCARAVCGQGWRREYHMDSCSIKESQRPRFSYRSWTVQACVASSIPSACLQFLGLPGKQSWPISPWQPGLLLPKAVSQKTIPVSILKIPKLSLLRGFKMYIWETQLRQLFCDSSVGRAGEEGWEQASMSLSKFCAISTNNPFYVSLSQRDHDKHAANRNELVILWEHTG